MSVTVNQNAFTVGLTGRRGRPGLLAAATEAEAALALVSGGGSDALAMTPLGLGGVLEDLGVMLNRIRLMRPTKAKPFTALKVSARRWWVATFVKDGGRQDYAIHEFVNHGPSQSPNLDYWWRYNGCVAWIDGIYEEFANLTGEDIGAGVMDSLTPPIWEPVVRIGPHTGYPTGFDYCGTGHGHLKGSTTAIYLNGATGTNYRLPANSPIGTLLRGTAFAFNQSATVYLPDDETVAGTLTVGHVMVEGGVNVNGNFNFTGTNIGLTTMFGAMLSGRGDTYKGNGVAAIDADREDGLEYGAGGVQNANYGEVYQSQIYNADRPTHILESVVVATGPVNVDGAGYSWAENGSNRDVFLQDRSEGYAKIYTHGVNKSTSWLVDGKQIAFNVTYRVRKGALI